MAQAQQEFYDRTATRFWDPLAGPVGRDLHVSRLLKGRTGSLLEYGFGAGSLLFHLARRGLTPAIGVDISEAAVTSATALLQTVPEPWACALSLYHVKDDRLTEVPDTSIENIVCVATIEHVLDPYKVLDELRRVAKPGATMICSVPNYAYLKHRVTLLLGGLPKTGTDEPVENWRSSGWDGMHLHTFNQESFRISLRDCGWTVQQWSGWGDRAGWLLRLRRAFPSLLSGELIARCVRA